MKLYLIIRTTRNKNTKFVLLSLNVINAYYEAGNMQGLKTFSQFSTPTR